MGVLIKEEASDLMSEINITPMVDVMLVLLVVFIVSAPLLMHAVNINLPKASAEPVVQETEHRQLNITKAGEIYMDSEKLSLAQLDFQLLIIANQPKTSLEVYADTKVEYGAVAEVMAAIQRAKVTQFSFILVPKVTSTPAVN